MTARKTAARKPTAVDVTPDEVLHEVHGMMEDIGAGLSKRMIVSTLVSLATSALGIAGAITVASHLALATLVLSGSAFLSLAVGYFIGIVGFLAAMLAGSYVARYIAYGGMADDFKRLTSWVSERSTAAKQRIWSNEQTVH
jgi:hypothetical protein